MSGPLINVDALQRSFGRRSAVSGVSVRLGRGETLALVGANGGGKTTTLRLLAGLLRPDGGTGHVLGLDIAHAGRRIAARAAYMPQKIALYPDISVRENLRFRAGLRGLPRPATAWQETARRFGLEDVLDRPAGVLSEGRARRVQLAATLLGAPALVLLDEPTAGLDPLARSDVWAEVAAMSARGVAVVVSTHDVSEAEACSSVLVLMEGRVAAAGPPAAVIATHPGCSTLEDCLRAAAKKAVLS